MCQICGKVDELAMCLKCQAYDDYEAGMVLYDSRKEMQVLNVMKQLLEGKRFYSFDNLYKYVNTVHMRNEIMKYDSEPYALSLRRDPDAILRLWRDLDI